MNLNDTLHNLNYKDGTNYLINLLSDDGMKTILSNILIPRIEKERDISFKKFVVGRWHVSKDRIKDYNTGIITDCRIRVFYSGDYIKGQSWKNDIKHSYSHPYKSYESFSVGSWTYINESIENRDLYKGIESEVTVSMDEFIPMYRDYVIGSVID